MDEENTSAAVATSPVTDETPLTEGSTPEPTESADNDSQTSEPTGPPPETDDTDVPDEGIDPDKGIDPDEGDTTGEKSESELKGMSRQERKEYFENLKQERRREIERSIDEVYQPQPIDQIKDAYLDQGYSDAEATLLARDEQRSQREQINEARAEIAELNMSMATEAMEVVNTIPWLNSQNQGKGYDEHSTEAASKLYEALAVERDQRTNQIVQAKISPKQFYTLIDQIRQSGITEATAKARKAAEREMAAVAPAASVTNKRDPSFNELSTTEKRAQLLAKGFQVT